MKSAVPQNVIAVAVDTNAFPKGDLRVKDLEGLAEVLEEQELETVVWVPEPVLWELAEHFWSELVETRSSLSRLYKKAGRAAIDIEISEVLPEYKSVSDVVEDFETRIGDIPGVEILWLGEHPDVPVRALRDQILRTRAGKTKSGAEGELVKTGASDSASFRLVASAAGDKIGQVVLITRDGDAKSHFDGHDAPIIISSFWETKKSLLLLIPGSEMAKPQIVEAVKNQAVEATAMQLGAADVEGGHQHFISDYFDEIHYFETSIAVSTIDKVISVQDVDVSKSEGFATATADCLVSLEVNTHEWSPFKEDFTFIWDATYDVLASVQVSLQLEDGEWVLEVDHVVIA